MCRIVKLGLFLAGLLVTPGACSAQDTPQQTPTDGSLQGVVYSVDGSGHLRAMALDLSQAVSDAKLPLRVESVNWSHGAGRIFADLHDQPYHRTKGKELAAAILARRRANPTEKIFVVSHSSGAAVALAAAEALPADGLDRIILLAPAVSAAYDLRPALRSSRQGIDVFFSRKDLISMSLVVVGTTDGHFFSSAGAVGFDGATDNSDRSLYANLRQIHWNNAMSGSGNYGGHFGFTRVGFFQTHVVPLLSSSH